RDLLSFPTRRSSDLLVRSPRAEKLRPTVGEAHVWPEELVRRADEDVDVPGGDVDRPVRRVVDGVGPGERTGLVGELDNASDVGSGADRVGGDREADQARALR